MPSIRVVVVGIENPAQNDASGPRHARVTLTRYLHDLRPTARQGRGLLRGPRTLAGTAERDVVVLRVVARRIWLRTDLHGLSVVLNMLRTVIFILRAQLSLSRKPAGD